MIRETLREDVDTAAALYDTEVEIRERARALELDPFRAEEAKRLFGRAEGLREKRLRLLHRVGLI